MCARESGVAICLDIVELISDLRSQVQPHEYRVTSRHWTSALAMPRGGLHQTSCLSSSCTEPILQSQTLLVRTLLAQMADHLGSGWQG